MTAAVQHVLHSFDRLAEFERLEAASEIIRRTATLDFPPLNDEALVLAAEELFLKLDEQEAADEHAESR